MKLSDLDFAYPEDLIALKPTSPTRVMWVGEDVEPVEISIESLLLKIAPGDALVINDTQVLRRRVFAQDLEILFLSSLDQKTWQVLFPSKKMKVGDIIDLPLGRQAVLHQKGRPQTLIVDEALDESYFEKVGELPLPPYIQKARGQRHNSEEDQNWYQTSWAEKPGSFAAPTASLHFSSSDLQRLKERQIQVVPVTLHVGLGTFLPVTAEDLNDHEMHSEFYEIQPENWQILQQVKEQGGRIWSLGTTATRALESAARQEPPILVGETNLLIQPGYEWKMVDVLLTNFHQPQSTLLALVSAFVNLATVRTCYQWAIERRFQLFSYGDLSAWVRPLKNRSSK